MIADRERLHHFPGIGIDDGCSVAAATDEQAPALAVDRYRRGVSAGIQKPLIEHRQLLRVERGHKVFFLQVDENLADAIGSEFRSATKVTRSRQLCRMARPF